MSAGIIGAIAGGLITVVGCIIVIMKYNRRNKGNGEVSE